MLTMSIRCLEQQGSSCVFVSVGVLGVGPATHAFLSSGNKRLLPQSHSHTERFLALNCETLPTLSHCRRSGYRNYRYRRNTHVVVTFGYRPSSYVNL